MCHLIHPNIFTIILDHIVVIVALTKQGNNILFSVFNIFTPQSIAANFTNSEVSNLYKVRIVRKRARSAAGRTNRVSLKF